MSLTVTKVSNNTCYKRTSSEEMQCLKDKLINLILNESVSCLPLQVYSIFDGKEFDMPLCQNDIDSALSAHFVSKINKYDNM